MRREGYELDFLCDDNTWEFYKIFKGKRCNRSNLETYDVLQHFRKVCNITYTSDNGVKSVIDDTDAINTVFPELDRIISENEVLRVLKGLKCRKAYGLDNLLNGYFIKFEDILKPLLVKSLNSILDLGVFPKTWSSGIIIPIHKGSLDDVNN
jgi:hypothetical protein